MPKPKTKEDQDISVKPDTTTDPTFRASAGNRSNQKLTGVSPDLPHQTWEKELERKLLAATDNEGDIFVGDAFVIAHELIASELQKQKEEIVGLMGKYKTKKLKTTPCPANPSFDHWISKKGDKAICGQCGNTIIVPKQITKDQALDDITKELEKKG